MQSLTCPIPENINPLQSNGFMFGITKLPEVTYFCQEVNIPGVSLPEAVLSTPFSDVPIPGDKMVYDDLNITFLIDENMSNYTAVYNWMMALGFPKSREQYKVFMASQPAHLSELLKGYSDGTLQVLSSSMNTARAIRFVDMFPTNLSSLQLQSTTSDTVYLAGNATFKYNYYEYV